MLCDRKGGHAKRQRRRHGSRSTAGLSDQDKGHLGRQWTDWFSGLAITLEDNGDTLLTGLIVDQAALHGLLRKVRDLGMPLISVSSRSQLEEGEKP
jgi:hypothetical protein